MLHDVGPDYLVMEYVEGQPLKGPLPVERAVELCAPDPGCVGCHAPDGDRASGFETGQINIRNTDPVFGGFAGEFVRNSAQMEWSATDGNLVLVSDPLGMSSSSFAQIGQERNGVFFP